MKKSLLDKIKKIKLLAVDVDGVLTDGTINIDHQGREIKVFDVQDGLALVLFKRAGCQTAIISARSSAAVEFRARDLGVDRLYQDSFPKMTNYKQLLNDFYLKDEEVCFIGDDLPDLEILEKVGLAVGVPNACREVKRKADYITQHTGGRGAVREVVELILKVQKKWNNVLNQYRCTV